MDGTIGLGATSIDKIGEVQLSDEIGEGCWNCEKMNFTITFRYKIPIFTIKSSNIKTKTISVSATSSLKYGFSTVSF